MFAQRYFGGRYFAARYWPKVGATPTFKPFFARNANTIVIGPTTPVTPVRE